MVNSFSNRSLRTIGLAYKDIKVSNLNEIDNLDEKFFEEKLILIGIAGIRDPPRPEIPSAIRLCKKAGITVRMVTGDNLATAVSISKECGILPPDPILGQDTFIVMEGKRFREMVTLILYYTYG